MKKLIVLPFILFSLLSTGCSQNQPASVETPPPSQASHGPDVSPPETGTSATPAATSTVMPETGAATPATGEDEIKVGSRYMQGETPYTVVGVGTTPFEYTATGESLELVVGDIPGTIVMVPAKGAVVKVDPTTASVTVDGEPHKPVTDNGYLQEHGKNVRWLMLELVRE